MTTEQRELVREVIGALTVLANTTNNIDIASMLDTYSLKLYRMLKEDKSKSE